jgi:hypothetical protein
VSQAILSHHFEMQLKPFALLLKMMVLNSKPVHDAMWCFNNTRSGNDQQPIAHTANSGTVSDCDM